MFEMIYLPSKNDKQIFGKHWCLPDTVPLKHGVKTLIALYEKNPKNGDGQHVEVYCTALPTMFYTIKALDGIDSVDKPVLGFTMSTGSSMAQLVADIAKAVSGGMLGLD